MKERARRGGWSRHQRGEGRIALAAAGNGQGVFYGVAHRLVHLAAVAKAHFDFGGVNVHVHPRGVNFQVQHVDRLAAPMQHVFIGGTGGVAQHLVTHVAAIHVGELLVST